MSTNLGKEVLKRWVKDYNLPIKIYQEPYFSYLIDLYDDYFNTHSKLELLKNAVGKFESEDKFLSYYYEVTDKAIDSIKSKEEFQEFNTGDLSKYDIKSNYPKNNIYKETCVDKYYVSIDLVKANYQALKYVNPSIVSNTNSYEEFIGLFTDLEYMTKSKYLRQVIFGNINPKRQVKVERYLIEQVIDLVIAGELFKAEDIHMASNDEVVFELSEELVDKYSSNANDLMKFIKDTLGIDVDIEVFKLVSIEGKYYSKEFTNKEGYELKGIPQIYFPQVYKKYNNKDLHDNDLVFYYEHQLAKFINPVF